MAQKACRFKTTAVFAGILLFSGLLLLQGQTFFGNRQTGFYKTQDDGAAFGYFAPRQVNSEKDLPLVVIFGKKAADVMTWKEIAQAEGAVIVCVAPKFGGQWNMDWDIDRALKKVKELKVWYPIDPNKIWAVGADKGGIFALSITVNHPEVFTAAAVTNVKTTNIQFQAGAADDSRQYYPFNFQDNLTPKRPFWILSYSKSELVKPEELKETQEMLTKNGFTVVYQSVEGEPVPITQKTAKTMFDWLTSQKA